MAGGQRRPRYCCVLVPMKEALEVNGAYQSATCRCASLCFQQQLLPIVFVRDRSLASLPVLARLEYQRLEA